ncbi:MAG: hypothetical protein Q7S09_02130 [bacterium]|nr:hypothetical protein [bacterium]
MQKLYRLLVTLSISFVWFVELQVPARAEDSVSPSFAASEQFATPEEAMLFANSLPEDREAVDFFTVYQAGTASEISGRWAVLTARKPLTQIAGRWQLLKGSREELSEFVNGNRSSIPVWRLHASWHEAAQSAEFALFYQPGQCTDCGNLASTGFFASEEDALAALNELPASSRWKARPAVSFFWVGSQVQSKWHVVYQDAAPAPDIRWEAKDCGRTYAKAVEAANELRGEHDIRIVSAVDQSQLASRYVLWYRPRPVLTLPVTLWLEEPLDETRPEALTDIVNEAFGDFFRQTGTAAFVRDTQTFSLSKNADLWSFASNAKRAPNTLNIFLTNSVILQPQNCGKDATCFKRDVGLEGRGFLLLWWDAGFSRDALVSNLIHELGHKFTAKHTDVLSAMSPDSSTAIRQIDGANLELIRQVTALVKRWKSFEPLFRLTNP